MCCSDRSIGGFSINLYQPQFDSSLDTGSVTEAKTTLVVASTPRSGSHMLGHAMGATGVIGTPFEYCNPANLAEWKRRLGLDDTRAALREIMRRRTPPNGVFSIKLHFTHCAALGGAKEMFDFFPNAKVVFIRRPDVLRQAISYAVAQQTETWIDGQQPVSDRVSYDYGRIAKCLRAITVQNALWTTAFAENGVVPIHLDFDRIQSDLPGEIGRILRFAGVAHAVDDLPGDLPTVPQGIASRSDDWIRRFDLDSRHLHGRRGSPQRLMSGAVKRLRSLVGA